MSDTNTRQQTKFQLLYIVKPVYDGIFSVIGGFHLIQVLLIIDH
jgi:hypothetical protein